MNPSIARVFPLRHTAVASATAGDYLVTSGKPIAGMFVILQGAVAVRHLPQEGPRELAQAIIDVAHG